MKFALKALLTLTLLINSCVLLYAQESSEHNVLAAFIYQFIQHTSWAEKAQHEHVVIAVYSDENLFKQLKNRLDQRTIKNKTINVEFSKKIKPLSSAHVAVIPPQANSQLNEIAFTLRKSETLLITQASKNLRDVMINLIKQDDKLSFELNKSNIVYENLTISSELLLLGGTEIDVATLYRETESALQSIKNRESQMQENVKLLETQLQQKQDDLVKKQAQFEQMVHQAELEKQGLLQARQALIERYNSKEKELITSLQLKNVDIAKSQEILKNKIAEIEAKKAEIQKVEDVLFNNNAKIIEQLTLIDEQQNVIKNKEKTIATKDTFLTYSILVIAVISLLALLIGALFVRNRKTTRKLAATLTELENTQSQLVESEKMASLGILTAGVAHEINTPLGVIVTSLSIIEENQQAIREKITQQRLSKSFMETCFLEMKKSSDIANASLERLTTIINSFKQVAVDHGLEEARAINLHDYILNLFQSLARELSRRQITFVVEGDATINVVTIPGSLAQVITNLITNAMYHAFYDKQSDGFVLTAYNVTTA